MNAPTSDGFRMAALILGGSCVVTAIVAGLAFWIGAWMLAVMLPALLIFLWWGLSQ